MSGIGYQYNKFESCSGCPDRTIEPNCHDTCSGYLYRQAKNERQKEQKRKEYDYKDYKIDRVEETKRKVKRK